MKLRNIIYCLLLLAASTAQAQTVPNENEDKWEKWSSRDIHNSGWIIRAGYVIGGTSPIPLPKEIRSINEFKPLGGVTVGADYYHMFGKRLGIQFGMHLFFEGFHTSADVKNYRMAITQGNSYLSGYFTGTDVTNTKMVGVTLPVTATFRMSPRWNVSVGPFFTFVGKGTFDGEVYDNSEGIGYLREGDPTGPKIEITRKNPANYDFSSENFIALMDALKDSDAARTPAGALLLEKMQQYLENGTTDPEAFDAILGTLKVMYLYTKMTGRNPAGSPSCRRTGSASS